MNKSTEDYTEVHAALHAYFSTKPQRDAMLNSIETDADFDAYEAADKKALLVVQEAFHAVTGAYNSMDKCLMVNAWELAGMTKYDLTVHNLKNKEEPKTDNRFDIRRIEGWSS